MAASTALWPDLLEPLIEKIYESETKKTTALAETIFPTKTTRKKYNYFLTAAGFGAASQVDEGDSVTYDDPISGFKKTFTQLRYGNGFQVTEDMWDFDQHDFIQERPARLARSMRVQVETLAAAIFNNAFTATTGTLTADGLPMCYASHTLLGGGTYGNAPSTMIDLSVTALEAALTSMALVEDDRGIVTPMTPALLLVHPSERWTAEKILGSSRDPDTANNTVNPMQNVVRVVVWPYLSDTDAWFLLSAKDELSLKLLYSKRPDLVKDTDSDTRTAKWNSFMRLAVGVVDWRGTYGSQGG